MPAQIKRKQNTTTHIQKHFSLSLSGSQKMVPRIFKYLLLLASVFICKTCGSQTDQDISDQDVWMPMLRGLPIGRDGEIVAEFEVKKV